MYKEDIDPNRYVSSKFKKEKYFFAPMSKKLPWMFIKEVNENMDKELKNNLEN